MTLTTSLRPATARSGFTLVEIVVVLGIIVVLVAITGVAIQKTTETQKVRTSKDQVYKLQKALDTEVERVVQQGDTDARRQQIPQQVVDYCESDQNRPKAVWTAMQLRRQFPDSFAEALTPFTGIPGYQLNPQATFLGVAGVGTAGGGAFTPEEGAALLYLILATKSVSGGGAMAASADELGRQTTVTVGGKQFKAFADAWGRPVYFCRWFGSGYLGHPLEAEVQQQQQYFGSVNQANPNNHDPLDTRNLVFGWANAPRRAQMSGSSVSGLGLWFNGNNRTATVFSLGKNPADPSDDIMGYQSRRFGR
jgi:prepilin-type N-terminal cleavage/methylation domain-containing protein